MPIHPSGATVTQDVHGLFGAFGLSFYQDIPIMDKRCGISSDDIGRQVVAAKLGFEGLENSEAVGFR
jgi:hypothetical protein